jgi:hypothetical protein
MAFAPENSATFNFEGNGLRDTVQNTNDIVVTISGAEAHIYLTLRKIGGYATKVETANFGAKDNEAVVGS